MVGINEAMDVWWINKLCCYLFVCYLEAKNTIRATKARPDFPTTHKVCPYTAKKLSR